MSTDLKRVTFSVTPEIEASLKSFKKEIFYDRSQSEMLRTHVSSGMRAIKTYKGAKEDKK
jgi:hypothetical protein